MQEGRRTANGVGSEVNKGSEQQLEAKSGYVPSSSSWDSMYTS